MLKEFIPALARAAKLSQGHRYIFTGKEITQLPLVFRNQVWGAVAESFVYTLGPHFGRLNEMRICRDNLVCHGVLKRLTSGQIAFVVRVSTYSIRGRRLAR